MTDRERGTQFDEDNEPTHAPSARQRVAMFPSVGMPRLLHISTTVARFTPGVLFPLRRARFAFSKAVAETVCCDDVVCCEEEDRTEEPRLACDNCERASDHG